MDFIMDKNEAYYQLFRLQDKGVEVTNQLNAVANNETVPGEVVKFIDDNTTTPYVDFIEKLRHNSNNNKSSKLYKNIVNENLEDDDKVISLTSYVTQVLLYCKQLPTDEDRSSLWKDSNIAEISKILGQYFSSGNTELIKGVFGHLMEQFKLLNKSSVKREEGDDN